MRALTFDVLTCSNIILICSNIPLICNNSLWKFAATILNLICREVFNLQQLCFISSMSLVDHRRNKPDVVPTAVNIPTWCYGWMQPTYMRSVSYQGNWLPAVVSAPVVVILAKSLTIFLVLSRWNGGTLPNSSTRSISRSPWFHC